MIKIIFALILIRFQLFLQSFQNSDTKTMLMEISILTVGSRFYICSHFSEQLHDLRESLSHFVYIKIMKINVRVVIESCCY